VCSHPRKGENTDDAAHRRIIEEMGFDCDFEEVFSFVYNADVGQGLTEHEFDHVFVGVSDTVPSPNKNEVDDWKYISMDVLEADVRNNPCNYTVWFKIALTKVLDYFKKIK
jgi:isopentenyl-diphosphate delta-isomerase